MLAWSATQTSTLNQRACLCFSLIFCVFYIILIYGILYGYCGGILSGTWGPSVVHWQILIRTLLTTHNHSSFPVYTEQQLFGRLLRVLLLVVLHVSTSHIATSHFQFAAQRVDLLCILTYRHITMHCLYDPNTPQPTVCM